LSQKTPAVLVLADGSVFRGCAIGADGQTSGEVVFNTAMTGYQEILTDPSYAGQVVTLTYPHIGNVGANPEDSESRSVFASGLVIRDLPLGLFHLLEHFLGRDIAQVPIAPDHPRLRRPSSWRSRSSSVMSRVTSCSARRLSCRSRSARLSASTAIRF